MTPTTLELVLTGEKKPSEIFGLGYNGPPKPSDWHTAFYLGLFMAAFGFMVWVVLH